MGNFWTYSLLGAYFIFILFVFEGKFIELASSKFRNDEEYLLLVSSFCVCIHIAWNK